MSPLKAMVFAEHGGSGPDHKRDSGRTNDISDHPKKMSDEWCENSGKSIPLTTHVRNEYHTSLPSYDENAYGKVITA